MKPTLRTATIEDLPQLEALEQKLIAFERTCDPQIKSGPDVCYYDLPNVINNPETSIIVVAAIDDQIVGCGMGRIKVFEKWAKGNQYGIINMLYTEEAYRSQSIARQVISKLTEWFQAKDVSDIRLKVYANNEGALKAYEKIGFVPFVQEMKLRD